MSELRVRAWSIKKRKYIDIDTLYCANEKVCGIVCGGVVYDAEDVVLEQDTGLKDKNGKEIYEGDIVDDGYSRRCEIKWSEHFTAFEVTNEEDGYVSNIWFVAKYGEVIGNIHENPELLGGEE